MAEKGYDRTTTADVAAAAELSRGVVHYHFKSKLEILLHLVDIFMAEHIEDLDKMSTYFRGPRDLMRCFIDFHVSQGDTDPDKHLFWITLGAEALREPAVLRKYQAALLAIASRLRELVVLGISTKDFTCERADVAVAAIVCAIQGYLSVGATTVPASLIPDASGAKSVKAMADGILGTREAEWRL